MKYFEFIPDGTKYCNVQAWIHAYSELEFDQRLRPAVVICPGGAYRMVSKREAEKAGRESSPGNRRWVKWCITWLNELFDFQL